jgi:hypothetical protein
LAGKAGLEPYELRKLLESEIAERRVNTTEERAA